MRRRAFASAASVLVAAVALGWSGVATADAPDRAGWWYALNQNGLAVPGPPTVSEGGLYLAQDPTGSPASIAALHFAVSGAAQGSAKLQLAASSGSTFLGATIAACPATSEWKASSAGAWADRPKFDCNIVGGGVPGTASADGSSMSWSLPASFQPDATTYDIVLDPQGAAPFSVAVSKPGADAFVPPPAAPASAPPAAPAVSDVSPTPTPASAPAAAPAPAPQGSVALPPSPPSASVPPSAAPTASGDNTQPQVAAPISAKAGDRRAERVMAVLLLFALGGALFWLGSRPDRAPRLIGTLRAESEPVTTETTLRPRGVGRFVRPRTAAPQRL